MSSSQVADPDEEALYASPEELLSNGIRATPKSDVYSLGMLFFELFNPILDAVDRRRALEALRHRILPSHVLRVSLSRHLPPYSEGPSPLRMSVCMVMCLKCHEATLSPDEDAIHPCKGKSCVSSLDICMGFCLQTRPQEAAFVLSLLHPDPASRPTVDSIVHSQLLLALHKSVRSRRTAGELQSPYRWLHHFARPVQQLHPW